jgi:hypothetical protein
MTSTGFSQQNILDGVYLESDEELVAGIESIKKDIDAQIPSYTKIEKAKDSLGYRGAYFDGKELKMVTVFYKEKELYKSVSWYFSKGKLVYAESSWTHAHRRTDFNDEKLYLENEHLFWWTIGGTSVEKTSVRFTKAAEDIGEYALKLKMENGN